LPTAQGGEMLVVSQAVAEPYAQVTVR
jgi:hypothetical protein